RLRRGAPPGGRRRPQPPADPQNPQAVPRTEIERQDAGLLAIEVCSGQSTVDRYPEDPITRKRENGDPSRCEIPLISTSFDPTFPNCPRRSCWCRWTVSWTQAQPETRRWRPSSAYCAPPYSPTSTSTGSWTTGPAARS